MSGLYIHFPFCRSRCVYCDFYSQTDETLKERYISAIGKEIELRKEELEGELQTIYLGGGTPSLFSVKSLVHLFETIQKNFRSTQDMEITMEANPDDLKGDYLQTLKSYTPINRLSIGMQSFREEDLKFLNRRHTGKEAIQSIEEAFRVGFNNLSLDLIYGLPEQTQKLWEENLNQALSLPITHLSTYILSIEEGTKLHQMVQEMRVQELNEEEILGMYNLLQERTQSAGMEHYEISNYAFEGYFSRHNSSYWEGIPYIGIGPSAHSFQKGMRRWNESSLHNYLEALEEGKEIPATFEILSKNEEYNEYILTRFRIPKGIVYQELLQLFGQEKGNYFLSIANKWKDERVLNFTRGRYTLFPQGVLLADEVIRDFIWIE